MFVKRRGPGSVGLPGPCWGGASGYRALAIALTTVGRSALAVVFAHLSEGKRAPMVRESRSSTSRARARMSRFMVGLLSPLAGRARAGWGGISACLLERVPYDGNMLFEPS
jgi:hypothetical protein